MQQFEYKVVPAPDKGMKIKGLKTPADRYAYAVSELMNQLSQDGWEYWRAETLPSEERKGLTGSITVYHNLLVFRRPSAEVLAQAAQGRLAAPAPTPVMATALSAGDGWPNNAPSRTVALSAGTTAALAAPVAAITPHAPEGPTPSLSARRGWFPDTAAAENLAPEETQPDAWAAVTDAENTAPDSPVVDTAPDEDTATARDGTEPVRNLFYGSDDDDELSDHAKDHADTDDTPPHR